MKKTLDNQISSQSIFVLNFIYGITVLACLVIFSFIVTKNPSMASKSEAQAAAFQTRYHVLLK